MSKKKVEKKKNEKVLRDPPKRGAPDESLQFKRTNMVTEKNLKASCLDVLSAYLQKPIDGHLAAIRFSANKEDRRPYSAYTLLGVQLCAPTLKELVEAMK